jgi:hypothetical protein
VPVGLATVHKYRRRTLLRSTQQWLYARASTCVLVYLCEREKKNKKITIVARRCSRHPLAVPHLSTFLEFIMHILILPGRLVKYPKVNSPYIVSVYCLAYIIYKMQLPWSYYKHTNMYKLYTHVYYHIILCISRARARVCVCGIYSRLVCVCLIRGNGMAGGHTK